MSRDAKTVLASALVLAAAVFSVRGFFFYRDNFSTHYPIKVLSAESFRSGEIPYWNFADAGGQPLAGNPNTLTFYPDNALYLFLPAHVAFNLHFLIHLSAAFFAMRALARAAWRRHSGTELSPSHAAFAATVYVLSGAAISATAFYNLIVAVAVLPLAFLAAERRSRLLLGCAFGLLGLAGEPVIVVAAVLAVAILAIDRIRPADFALAIAVAAVIALPQLIAYSEIAAEVERSAGMSARTVLNASLHPVRIVEIFLWPVIGFLNDAGGPFRARLFSTLFLGVIAVPALVRRSRYGAVAAVMLFFALGRYNPVVAAVVDNVAAVRIVRFPEKFALPLIVALIVLVAMYFQETRFKMAWAVITIVPLLYTSVRALPVDWFRPYETSPAGAGPHPRIYRAADSAAGVLPAREEYHRRVLNVEPLFGAAGGLRYVINPSPEGMHALRSRMVLERFNRVTEPVRAKYLRISGRTGPDALPQAIFVQSLIPARDIYQEAGIVESPKFDERSAAVFPLAHAAKVRSIRPRAGAVPQVTSWDEQGQRITIGVRAPAEALLIVNQTWFSAWVARAGNRELDTLPIDIDRLGIVIPAGTTSVDLHFGRRRTAVTVAWIASLLLLLFTPLIEKRDRLAREVERAGDEEEGFR